MSSKQTHDEDYYKIDIDSIESYEDFPDESADSSSRKKEDKSKDSRKQEKEAGENRVNLAGGLPKLSKAQNIRNGIIGGLTLIAIIVLCFLAAQRTDGDTAFYYIENGELFRSGDSGKSIKISSGFVAGEGFANPVAVQQLADGLLAKVFESKDGGYVFYPDNNPVTGDTGTYYCRKTDGSGSVIRIDANVTDITLASKSASILYKTGPSLCRFSPSGGSSVICADIIDYVSSDNLDTVYYIDAEGSLYLSTLSGKNELLERDVTSLGGVNSSGALWFVKNGVLYVKPLSGDKQKICSEAHGKGFLTKTNTPGFYFLTASTELFSFYSLINDPFKDDDALLTKPAEPSEPVRERYPTAKEYDAAYAVYKEELEAYAKALEAYNAKVQRDAIRDTAGKTMIGKVNVTLNYCDGETVTAIADNVIAPVSASVDGVNYFDSVPRDNEDGGEVRISEYQASGLCDGPVFNGSGAVAYLKKQDKALPSIDIGNFTDFQSLMDFASAALTPSCVLEIASGLNRVYFETGSVTSVAIAKAGDFAYYFSDPQENTDGFTVYDLHKVDLKTKEDKVIDKKVTDKYFDPDACLYYKEPKTGFTSSTLCANGKRISEKVLPGSAKASGNTVCFITDYSGDTGTLNVYNGRRIKYTAAGVYSFILTKIGSPVFIGQYQGPGDNTLFYNTESKEIAKDVSGVAPAR